MPVVLILWTVAWLPFFLHLFAKVSGISDFVKWYKEYKIKEKENE